MRALFASVFSILLENVVSSRAPTLPDPNVFPHNTVVSRRRSRMHACDVMRGGPSHEQRLSRAALITFPRLELISRDDAPTDRFRALIRVSFPPIDSFREGRRFAVQRTSYAGYFCEVFLRAMFVRLEYAARHACCFSFPSFLFRLRWLVVVIESYNWRARLYCRVLFIAA